MIAICTKYMDDTQRSKSVDNSYALHGLTEITNHAYTTQPKDLQIQKEGEFQVYNTTVI